MNNCAMVNTEDIYLQSLDDVHLDVVRSNITYVNCQSLFTKGGSFTSTANIVNSALMRSVANDCDKGG